ncbi:MAG: hypothetical protein U0869_25870 [Chloroflexota bacterium]
MTATTVAPPSDRRPAAPGWLPLALLLLAGLALRLLLAFVVFPRSGLRFDVDLFAEWTRSLVDHGPGGVYATTPSLNYPPAWLWVLWANGELATAWAGLTGGSAADAIAVTVKLPAIMADVLVAWAVYRATRRWTGDARWGLAVAAAWLFVPVTWMDGALWGQVDVAGVLLGGLAVIWLIDRRPELATAAAMLALLAKPQFALFAGVVGVVLLRRHLRRPGPEGWRRDREGPVRLLTSAVVAIAVALVVTLPFDTGSRTDAFAGVPVLHGVAGLVAVMASTAGAFADLTANAFNPWALVGPTPLIGPDGLATRWTPDSLPVLGVPASVLGAALYLAITAGVVALLWRRPDRDGILVATVILAAAFFVVPTRVHERYLFTAVGIGALLLPRGRGWWAWFALAATILAVNIHAILLSPGGWAATDGLRSLPFGNLARDPRVATLVALACVPMLAWPILEGVRLWRAGPDPAGQEARAAR